jgi:hypothetical protein
VGSQLVASELNRLPPFCFTSRQRSCYNSSMDTVSRNIVDLGPDQRTLLEEMLGTPLTDAQRVIIQVVDSEPKSAPSKKPLTAADYAIFADLDDEIVDELIEAINQRSPGREFDFE